jgi:chromosome partitioning protein
MRKIVVAALKGGTAKSSSVVSLAVGLANGGRRVLVIDCDPQGNASWILSGGNAPEGPTLADVLTRQATAVEAIRATSVSGLSLLPSDVSLGAVNVQLASEPGRDARLRSALAPIGAGDHEYDFALLDTGPTVTTVWLNALVYADEVVAPIDVGVFSVLGLVELEGAISALRDAYNPTLRLAGLILTRVQRNNLARDVERQLRERFGSLVFEQTVPLSVKFDEAHSRGETVMTYAPDSPGALAYSAIVREMTNGERARAKEKRSRGRDRGNPRAAGAA